MSSDKRKSVKRLAYLGIPAAAFIFALAGAASTHPALAQSTSCANSTSSSCATELTMSNSSIWLETSRVIHVQPIGLNETYVEAIGHGNLTDPQSGKTVNATTAAFAIVSGKNPTYTHGWEIVRTADGSQSGITFYRVIAGLPTTAATRGVSIAAFDNNGTGFFAPFNGVIAVGTYAQDINNNAAATVTYWKWMPSTGTLMAVRP